MHRGINGGMYGWKYDCLCGIQLSFMFLTKHNVSNLKNENSRCTYSFDSFEERHSRRKVLGRALTSPRPSNSAFVRQKKHHGFIGNAWLSCKKKPLQFYLDLFNRVIFFRNNSFPSHKPMPGPSLATIGIYSRSLSLSTHINPSQ